MRALVTGVSGQDGCYLADLLLGLGYEVHGTTRRPPAECFCQADLQAARLRPLADAVRLHQFAAGADVAAFRRLLESVQPDELYNFAAQTFVPASHADPVSVGESAGFSAARLLEAVRSVNPRIRVFQASSSVMYGGDPNEAPKNERTPFRPSQPYGIAKTYAHFMTGYYREHHGLFASAGILFNHESPLRREEFVTRKITAAAARIGRGERIRLPLGNLDAQRDWGFAGDFVMAMWQILQQPKPDDFVIATGQKHSVREFAELAFARLGLKWQDHVDFESSLLRSSDNPGLGGDASKARRILAWNPRVSFEDLVAMMVDADAERAAQASQPVP
jgi:GDPmannose 4,6-dehydratase